MKIFFAVLIIFSAASAKAGLVPLSAPAGPASLAPSLATLNDDRVILPWLERADEGHVLKLSVFDGQSFQSPAIIAFGEGWFANWADTPGLFVMPDGRWLAHWLVSSGPAVYAYDVVMSVSEDQGESWSESFSPHDDGTPTEHGFVSYFPVEPESAGVVWLDGRETLAEPGQGDQARAGHDHHHSHGGAMTLRTARVSGTGVISDPALLDEQVCDCCQTAAAMTDMGPLVIYRGRTDEELRDIWMVRGTDNGWSKPEVLHEDGWQIGGCPVNGPALIARGSMAVAAWFTMAENRPLVRLARSDNAGQDFSTPLEFSPDSALGRVDLAWLDSDFVLSWMDQAEDGAALQLARFDSQGQQTGRYSLDGLAAERVSGVPRIAPAGQGRLLVVWTASGREGSRVQAALLEPQAWEQENRDSD